MEAKEDVLLSARAELTDLGRLQEHSDLSDWPGRAVSADSEPANGHFDRRSAGRSRVKMKGKKHGVKECCCNEKWVEFTENTSLHGLRYIWLRDAFLFRRLLWLVLTLACSGIMMYQILDRIIYFDNKPVTVDVRINFNTTLDFPAVTICNQNAFRASATAELGYYDLLTDLYGNAHPVQAADLDRYSAQNVSTSYLYAATTHQINDLLVSCKWRGERCGQENFTQVATDHGMCYTFDSKGLIVDSAGAEDGLSLTLNVEQYEYMPGPHDAAGVKILVHHKNEFPKVHALGQAMSAGVHSFIAVRLVSVENLPYPHGECDSPRLTYFSQYWTANCETECTMRLLQELCGCKLFYMPGEIGDIPVCTLGDIYDCYIPKKCTYYFIKSIFILCPAIPCPAIPSPAIPCPAITCPATPCPAIPSPAIPCPAIPSPAIPCPAIPCPAIPSPAIPCPAIPCPTIPSPAIPCPAIPCPTIPSPAIPCPAIPCPAIPCPTIPSPAIPCPAIPSPAIPCPAIPCPAIPSPAIPSPAIPSVLRERMVAECYCPVPCSFLVFDPLASYAVASPLVVERFLADVNKSALAAKFDLAREASTHRHEPEKRKLFKEQLDDLEASSPLAAAFAQRPVSETDEQKKGLLDVETEIVGLWNETSYLFKYQKSSSKRTSFGLQRHEEYRQSIDMFLNDGLGYTVTFLEERHTKFNLHLRDFKAEPRQPSASDRTAC
ncbi:hypothetical protein BaRGS_00027925 [Batillaria attramentaria]|uniref:Uncharacterized protein n=1 Tax=Batillaria attramentaria TaxID=370345 RepID=A0ABD0K1C0_9CAEN